MKLDGKDLAILKLLENDSKKTTQQISKEIGVPITTIHNRIKKLESSGIIEKDTVWVNWKKLGRGINARLSLKVGRDGDQDEIKRLLPVGFAEGDRFSDAQIVGIERYC